MAKPTGPLLSLGASGTLAKTVTYSKWKGQPYVRQRVIPANPQTVAQTQTRSVFANAGEIWKQAPTLLQAPWNRFADGQVLTGRNAFMGRWVQENRGETDLLSSIGSPGAKGGLAPLTLVTTPLAPGIQCDITEPATPDGWTLEAAVAAVIRDQDPQSGSLFITSAGEDVSTPFQVDITGLVSGQLYVVWAWLRWAKPDGSIAYGPSITSTETPT